MATYNVSRPNFLGSEIGLVTKTISLDATTNSSLVTVENGASIIKAGTLYSASNIQGIIFQDVDVTGSTATAKVPAPLMVAGFFINDATVISAKVTSSTTPSLATFAAQGLFPMVTEPASVVRPY